MRSRQTLGDPTLEIAYWLPESGRYVSAPTASRSSRSTDDRAVTLVEHAGPPDGRDPARSRRSKDEPELVEAVAAAAGLWLDNERLQAKLRALSSSSSRPRSTRLARPCSAALDREGRIANLNLAATRASGYSDQEGGALAVVLGRCSSGPEERDDSRVPLRGARRPSHQSADFEHSFVNRVGKEVTVAWSTAPLYDEQGNVRSVICGGLDITERRQRSSSWRWSATSQDRREHDPDLPRRRALGRRDGERIRPEPGVRAPTRLEARRRDRPEPARARAPRRPVSGRNGDQLGGERRCRRSGASRAGSARTALFGSSRGARERSSGGRTYRSSSSRAPTSPERREAGREIRASRSRIVEAGDEARRRLERNLHDGAQQRLVALALSPPAGAGEGEHRPSRGGRGPRLGTGGARGRSRRPARAGARNPSGGAHRPRPRSSGRGPSRRARPVPVEVETTDEPLPRAVEAAAYYVIAESLANVSKYAEASTRSPSASPTDNGCARIEVADDGVGGADAAGGSGSRGLADRIAALEGTPPRSRASPSGRRHARECGDPGAGNPPPGKE